ncbi:MAG: hypothetical protein JWO94_3362, partial [Verrucomicrobiaceae bacterium]|nr:hypothetical protein [Verrucomicrobiaceae bacterium]
MQISPCHLYMKFPACLLACFGCFAWLPQLRAEARVWTNTEDKQIMAELLRVDNGAVVLRLPGGKQAVMPLSGLSAADQAWVKSNGGKAGATVDEGGRPAWDRRFMPGMVQEPMMDMNIKVVKESPGDCLYESGHFQFKTTAKL